MASPGAVRGLTRREQAHFGPIFEGGLRIDQVRLLAAPRPVRPFAAGRWFGLNWIVLPVDRFAPDFCDAAIGDQALLVHELVHAWQAEQGRFLPIAKLKAGDGQDAYVDRPELPFHRLNIEQQAVRIETAFLQDRREIARQTLAEVSRRRFS